jgi:hypothetical protein
LLDVDELPLDARARRDLHDDEVDAGRARVQETLIAGARASRANGSQSITGATAITVVES